MTDYIKREDAINARNEYLNETVERDSEEQTVHDRAYAEGWNACNNEYLGNIKELPSEDVAPVVRCEDCKCWTEWDNGTGSCSRFALDWIGTDADDFCSMGERKDDE